MRTTSHHHSLPRGPALDPRSARAPVAMLAAPLVALSAVLACGSSEQAPVAESGPVAKPQGRWNRVDEGAGKSAALERLKELEAIGYASGTVEAEAVETGVVRHDRERAQQGLNFYTSGHFPGALLMDMDGNVLHRWEVPFDVAFPGRLPPSDELSAEPPGTHHWRRAYLLEGGDVIAMYGGLGMLRVNRDSEVVWTYDKLVHHDFQMLPTGELYTLIRAPRADPISIAEDFVVLLDVNGRELERWSVFDAVRNSDCAWIWDAETNNTGDIFHTNALRILDERAAQKHPAFQPGRIRTSMRRLDALAVLDLELGKCVWALKGDFRRQHDPRIVDGGNLLFFDNNRRKVGSAVLEFDLALDPPRDKGNESEVWAYRGSEAEPFWSRTCGVAWRLSGGTTLIIETDRGRAFEVTRAGEIVWEFITPHRAGPNGDLVASLFDVQRMPLDTDWGQGR